MTDDNEAYTFYVETELSELAYQLIDLRRKSSPELFSRADSSSLTELLTRFISIPNPFIQTTGEEGNSDDDEWVPD